MTGVITGTNLESSGTAAESKRSAPFFPPLGMLGESEKKKLELK